MVNAFTVSLIEVIEDILSLYVTLIIIGAILSWLIQFGVVNHGNKFVDMLLDFISRITEPFLKHIRRIIPPVGGFDLSPLVLIFIVYFLERFIARLVFL